MDQISLCGTEDPWLAEERVTPKSGRPLTLRYHLVQDEKALARMVEVASAAAVVAHDTETSGLCTALGARAIGHALACQTGPTEISCWYVPIRHLVTAEAQLPLELVREAMTKVLSSPGRCVWAHAKFDWAMNAADSIACTREAVDVLVEANIADENEPSFALKALAAKYVLDGARTEEAALEAWMKADARKLGLKFKSRAAASVEEVGEPTYLEKFGYARAPVRLCGKYACRDVFYTLYLGCVTYSHVPKRYPLIYQREMKCAQRLFAMETTGLPIDEAKVRDVQEKTGQQVLHWLREVRRLSGIPDLTTTDDNLRALLYGEGGLKLTCPKWTDGGKTRQKKQSVDREARELLKRQYPAHEPLLTALGRLADASKYHTTYSGNFLRYFDPTTERIYPSYNQLEQRDKGVPVTGRLSSSNPNIQNIAWKPLAVDDPITGQKFEIAIREYFLVPKGHVRAYIDFSQIELRVLAWFCQDPNLLRAYREGLDVHEMTATLLSISRKIAKQVNFGNSYGMTEVGLALRMPGYYEDPDGTREEAKRVLAAFFERYAAINQFKQAFAERARRNHNTFSNPFGRPRRIPWLSEFERWKRARAERQMMSSIISGTAADLMKECMIRSTDILAEQCPGARLVQSVHDELVFDFPNQPGWSGALASVIRMMEDWPLFSASGPDGRGEGVPIEVSCELTSTSWADKREIKLLPDGQFLWVG